MKHHQGCDSLAFLLFQAIFWANFSVLFWTIFYRLVRFHQKTRVYEYTCSNFGFRTFFRMHIRAIYNAFELASRILGKNQRRQTLRKQPRKGCLSGIVYFAALMAVKIIHLTPTDM